MTYYTCPGRAVHASRTSSQKLSLVLLDKVCERSKMREMFRGFRLWKHNIDAQRHIELEAECATATQLLKQHRESEEELLRQHSRKMTDERTRIMRECEARQVQEITHYKSALLRQRQRLLQTADAWSKQQVEHSAISAETDEMLRLGQQRSAEIYMASTNTIKNLESTVQNAESKLRDTEGLIVSLNACTISLLFLNSLPPSSFIHYFC